MTQDEFQKDLRRATACQVACDGIPTEALEQDIVRQLLWALEEALRIASDENNEVFRGNMAARESAIIAWKQNARRVRAAVRGQA